MATTLFRNARLFDGLGDESRDGTDVLVEDGRIMEVSETGGRKSADIEIDCAGRTLMPGLIDAHVHVFAINLVAAKNRNIPLTQMTAMAVPRIRRMLDRGFTSVRDVAGGDYGIRAAVAEGYIDGPRLFVGGPGFSQTGGHCDHRSPTHSRYDDDLNASALHYFQLLVDGPDEMRRAVRNELRKGADHIKLMCSGGVGSPSDAIDDPQFSAEEIQVAVHEAGVKKRYVCAHVYTNGPIRHAVENGVRTVEHCNYIDEDTARLVKKHDAYVVPTLVCYDTTERHGEELGLSPYVMQKLRDVNNVGDAMLENCARAGVRMGFGTDLMGQMEFAQSHEFVIRGRVEGNAAVLRSATSVNAEILQCTDELGVVKPGALADLIVVDGDPLADISLLDGQGENIPVIMKDGALYRDRLGARAGGSVSQVVLGAAE